MATQSTIDTFQPIQRQSDLPGIMYENGSLEGALGFNFDALDCRSAALGAITVLISRSEMLFTIPIIEDMSPIWRLRFDGPPAPR